jgi:hypothetical protein
VFGRTIEIQPGHPGMEEPPYMLHVYFKPGGKVLFGTDPQTTFDPDDACPEASASATPALCGATNQHQESVGGRWSPLLLAVIHQSEWRADSRNTPYRVLRSLANGL